METAYPGSNVLVVTLTNGESKRVEAQSDEETLKEAMEVLRDMFGPNIPNATDILVPRWWKNRFQRGSYSNYPIISNNQVLHDIKVIFFAYSVQLDLADFYVYFSNCLCLCSVNGYNCSFDLLFRPQLGAFSSPVNILVKDSTVTCTVDTSQVITKLLLDKYMTAIGYYGFQFLFELFFFILSNLQV